MKTSKKRPKRKSEEEVSSRLFVREEKKKEKWQDLQFLSAAKDGIDCGDRQCYIEYKVLPDCFIYLETNNTNCIIPCKLDGCEREFHHFIVCPIWNCEAATTTTTMSTTSTTTSTTSMTTTTFTTPRTTTTERPSSNKMSALIYTSIVFNIFLFAIVFAVIIHKIRARWQQYQSRRQQNTSQNDRPVPPDPNQYYSLDSNSDSETDPLITPERRKGIAKSAERDSTVPTTIVNENTNVEVEPPPSVHTAEPKPSCSHWQDVELTVPESPPHNESAATLNEALVTKEPQPKKESGSVFLKMKIFNKKS